MKTIRNLTILVGLSAALFALVATGAKAQILSKASFTGTFTLPVQAQWGTMTLPAGDYSLEYGRMSAVGPYLVTIARKEDGSAHSITLVSSRGDLSATKNQLNCVREADTLLVLALELPAIGESAHFLLPHGVEVEARILRSNLGHNANTQLTEVVIPIQRVPVKANGK